MAARLQVSLSEWRGDACVAAVISAATSAPRRMVLSDGCRCLLCFRLRPRGWSRLLPRRNCLVSMGCCTSAKLNLYRSGSAIGAQSLTSGISGARRASSSRGRAERRPSTHLRIQPKPRTGTDASRGPRAGAKRTTLTRPRRPRRPQINPTRSPRSRSPGTPPGSRPSAPSRTVV